MVFSISPSDLGVVIQGPIQSVGRTLTDLKFRQYDATSDVKAMLKVVNEIGATPIVVTWLEQNLEGFSISDKEYIEKISFPRANVFSSIRNDWNRNSKYRQYYSTLVGVQKLKKRGCKYVLKVRTDNLVNIGDLISFIFTLTPLEANNFFYSPLINLGRPHMFYDFYSFASVSKMEEFCNVILYEKERTTNIHFDVFYRWTKHEMGSRISLKDLGLIYPKYPFFNQSQLRLVRTGLKEVFRPLPKQVWMSLYWRGEQLGSHGLKEQYRFAENSIESVMSDFDDFQYQKSGRLNVSWFSIPSFFVTSRIELQLYKLLDKLRSVRHKLLQLL